MSYMYVVYMYICSCTIGLHYVQCTLYLHMSVMTQNGYSALMVAAMEGKTEVVVELVKAGANVDMQNNVCQCFYMHMYIRACCTYKYTCMYVVL